MSSGTFSDSVVAVGEKTSCGSDLPSTTGDAAKPPPALPRPRPRAPSTGAVPAAPRPCSGIRLAAEIRQVHEAERVQPMRDADDDDIVLAREVGAVVRNHVGRSGAVAAAVEPDHDGPPAAGVDARGPDVQVQAVFTHRLAQVERLPF